MARYITLGYTKPHCPSCDTDQELPIVAATVHFGGNQYFRLTRFSVDNGDRGTRLAYEIDCEVNETELQKWLDRGGLVEVKEDELGNYKVVKLSETRRKGIPLV